MTHASSVLSSDHRARRLRRPVDWTAIVAAAFFLAVCAAEIGLDLARRVANQPDNAHGFCDVSGMEASRWVRA